MRLPEERNKYPLHIIQAPLFDPSASSGHRFEAFIADEGNDRLVVVLEALPAEKLLGVLEREHWTGRKGYSVRGMWSALVAGLLYQCPTMADMVRLLKRNKEVRTVCGFPGRDEVPSEDALGRFLNKLVEHEALLEGCFAGLVERCPERRPEPAEGPVEGRLRQLLPNFGARLAVDSTDIKAYANGHRQRPSDPDARWGAKGAGHHGDPKTDAEAEAGQGEKKGKKRDLYYWFGYKLHLVVDAVYELPVSFMVTPANESDTKQRCPELAEGMKVLLEKAVPDKDKTKPEAIIADKGYDSQDNCRLVFGEYGAAPIIPIRERDDMQRPDIPSTGSGHRCNGKGTPTCSCGLAMTYWGRDGNYLKYRCPQAVGKGQCTSRFRCTASPYGYVLKLPIMQDPRRYAAVPRETKKWQRLYRLRSAVERVNSRVKGLLGLDRITLRGMAKITVRSLLSPLVMLAAAVGMAQRHRLKHLRGLVT